MALIALLVAMTPEPSYSAQNKLQIFSPEKIPPLGRNDGFLLLNADIHGSAPSIELMKLGKLTDSGVLKEIEPSRRKTLVIDLAGADGLRVASLPSGIYQIVRVNVPYFNLPYRKTTDTSELWRFEIQHEKLNYIGNIVIEKERSKRFVRIQRINRLAKDLDKIQGQLQHVTAKFPLVSSTGAPDEFLTLLNSQ